MLGAASVVEGMQISCGDGGSDWRLIDRKLRQLAKRRTALDLEEAAWLVKAERAKVHLHRDYGSFLEYIEVVCGYGPKTAIDRLRVAHALDDFPVLREAELPFSAVREIARVVTAENVDRWIETCRGKTLREIEVAVSGHKRGDDPDAPRGPENHVLRLELRPETLALLREVQRDLADETGGAVDDDALINALCRAYETGGTATNKKPAYAIAITTCDTCARTTQDGGGLTVDVSPAVRDQARCDAAHVGRLDAPTPTPPTVDIPAATRTLVWRRDHGHCAVPGCRAKRNLELHHIKHREHGGTHEPENLILLCSGHHAAHHRGALAITGTGSRPHFARITVPPPPPPAKTVDDDVRFLLTQMDFSPRDARAAVEQAAPTWAPIRPLRPCCARRSRRSGYPA